MPEDDDDDLAVHPRIRRESRTPLYVQVADLIEEYIRDNGLRVDDRIPRESYLAEEYMVAPGTIRHALAELRDRRVVVTSHGRGTFVARIPRRKR